jgi:hypothetical protein
MTTTSTLSVSQVLQSRKLIVLQNLLSKICKHGKVTMTDTIALCVLDNDSVYRLAKEGAIE